MEKSDAKFLFLVSENDLSTPAKYSANVLAQRLKNNGKEKNCEVMVFKDTGHLLEPPNLPFCPFSFHKVVGIESKMSIFSRISCKSVYIFTGGYMAWGGEAESHAKSQEKMWAKLINYWSTHIGKPLQLPNISESDLEKSKL